MGGASTSVPKFIGINQINETQQLLGCHGEGKVTAWNIFGKSLAFAADEGREILWIEMTILAAAASQKPLEHHAALKSHICSSIPHNHLTVWEKIL